MNFFGQSVSWIFDPAHFSGPDGIAARVLAHLLISVSVLLVAAFLAVPLGYVVGHTGRGRAAAVGLSGAIRALPTLGLIILIGLGVGIGLTADRKSVV